jgi:hypothetical protein
MDENPGATKRAMSGIKSIVKTDRTITHIRNTEKSVLIRFLSVSDSSLAKSGISTVAEISAKVIVEIVRTTLVKSGVVNESVWNPK